VHSPPSMCGLDRCFGGSRCIRLIRRCLNLADSVSLLAMKDRNYIELAMALLSVA
jgi:hypothetical protein